MHDTLTLLAVLTTWGLIPAALHVLISLQVARSAQKRKRLASRRLHEWRTRVPYVTPKWPRQAYMGHACQDEGVLWYVSTCRRDALRNEVTTIAQRALSDPSTHIEN